MKPATSYVQLAISGRNLIESECFEKKVPLVVTYIQPSGVNQWHEYGRSEIVLYNTNNPDFNTKLNFAYHFGECQKIKFEVYRLDPNSQDAKRQELIGWVQTTLGNVVTHRIIQKKILFHDSSLERGTLIVSAEELATGKEEVELYLRAQVLENTKSWFGKWRSRYVMAVISKPNDIGDYIPVHKTEIVKVANTLAWKNIVIPVRNLNNGDYSRILKLACWSWNRNNSVTLVGEAFFSLDQLLRGPLPGTYPCINPDKKEKKVGYVNSGKFTFARCLIFTRPSFLDYLQGGTEISCTLAIDFSASNGDPKLPSSLHYLHGGPSPYQQAISSIVEIMEDYITDSKFAVIGFGAKIPPIKKVSQEFTVNPADSYCDKAAGVVAAYRACLPIISLASPAKFAPSIRRVIKQAQMYQDGSRYHILIIFTNGKNSDMADTKEALMDASGLPISIIIVGLGNSDFLSMRILDSDNIFLTAPSGRKAQRDIVQFVPFNNFLRRGSNAAIGRSNLASQVLREVPDQFLGYMKSINNIPKPANYSLNQLPSDPVIE